MIGRAGICERRWECCWGYFEYIWVIPIPLCAWGCRRVL